MLKQQLRIKGLYDKIIKRQVNHGRIIIIYSKTPIYRASWGKGIRPGKSRSTVYRCTFYTDLHTKLVFGG